MGEPRTQAGRRLLGRLGRAALDVNNPVGRGWSVEEAILAIEDEARSPSREGLRTALDEAAEVLRYAQPGEVVRMSYEGLAALSSPPDRALSEGLDVERLATAICATREPAVVADTWVPDDECRAWARRAVSEYAALASPAQEQGAET